MENQFEEEKRYLLFLMRPVDALNLLRKANTPGLELHSMGLPPDVGLVEIFFDEKQNYLGLVLESEEFEPVKISIVDGVRQAPWNRAVFQLEEQDEDEPLLDEETSWREVSSDETLQREPQKPVYEEVFAAYERGFHLRALVLSAQSVFCLLGNDDSQLPSVTFPHETHILSVFVQADSWILLLEHPSFEECAVGESEGEVYVEIPGFGGELTLRIVLPGATLEPNT